MERDFSLGALCDCSSPRTIGARGVQRLQAICWHNTARAASASSHATSCVTNQPLKASRSGVLGWLTT
jgi:hypothetical protein